MKRTALIILIFLYTLSCLGMGVEKFYCCGKLASVSFLIGTAESTPKAKKESPCCKHEKQSFKVKDSHYGSAKMQYNQPVFAPAPIAFIATPQLSFSAVPDQAGCYANAPPGVFSSSLYRLYQNYRI